MKKLFALLLAVVMLLSMTACGGSAEPVETAPATTEPVVTKAPTEAPTEEPTIAPTEAPRVAPTDFEAVDPETLPEPIPVEEQLQSEDTQTVTLGSLEEYEDLLWSLGFKEVRLTGTHEIGTVYNMGDNVIAYCEPVSLTYNNQAFRFNFTYCMTNPKGDIEREYSWYMYGTKSTVLANASTINESDFYKQETHVISLNYTQEELMELLANGADLSALLSGEASQEHQVQITTPNYEEEFMGFVSRDDETRWVNMKAVYYPITGNLYNYMCDVNSEGKETQLHGASPELEYKGEQGTITRIGEMAQVMCFHYLFPTEDAAE